MKKHPLFIFRTIRNGRIKWNHRYWKTNGDVSHIEGEHLVFGTYSPEYNLLCLWGTIEAYKYPTFDDKKGSELWNEICDMMGVEQKGDGLSQPSGSYLMENCGNDWVAWKSRMIEWWKPIVK